MSTRDHNFHTKLDALLALLPWKHGLKWIFQGVKIKRHQYVSFVRNFVEICDSAFPHDFDAYRELLFKKS